MKNCNVVGAVIYLEELQNTLLGGKQYEAAEILGETIKDIVLARSEITTKASLAGAMTVDIYGNLGRVFTAPPKPTASSKSAYATIAGFKLGEVKTVTMAELFDLAGEIAAHADNNRGVTINESTKNYLQTMTNIVKAQSFDLSKPIAVKLVNSILAKVTDPVTGNVTEREELGVYRRKDKILEISLNPNKDNLSKESLTVTSGKVVLHEIVHAMTVEILANNPELNAKVDMLRKHAVNIYKRANDGKDPSYTPGSDTYGLLDTREFIAEIMTSNKLQKLLAGMEPTKTKNIVSRVKTLFAQIVSKFKAHLKIAEDTYTLLDEAIEAVEAVFSNDAEALTVGEQEVVNIVAGVPDNSNVRKGSVIEYTNTKGVVGEYIVKGISKDGKNLKLISLDTGENVNGTPQITNRSIKHIRDLPLYTHTDNVEYILDEENNRVYTESKGLTNHSDNVKNKMFDSIVSTTEGIGTNTEKDVVQENETTSDGYKFKKGDNTFTTNRGQTAVINDMKKWYKTKDPQKPHFLLQGRGGTGKTTVINVLLDELGTGGGDVMFATHMHKAYVVLKEANIGTKYEGSQYKTIASILGLKPSEKDTFKVDPFAKEVPLPKVLVLDESSMIQSDHYRMLLQKAAEYNTKIIFMGDSAQLPPVNDPDPEAAVRSLVFNGQKDSTTHLNELMRQGKDSPIVTATDTIISAVTSIEDSLLSNSSKVDKEKTTGEALSSIHFDGALYGKYYDRTTGEGVIVTKDNFSNVLPHLVNDLKNDLTGTKYIHFNNYLHKNTIEYMNKIRAALFDTKADELLLPGEPLVLNSSYIPVEQEGPDGEIILNNAEEFVVVSSERTKMSIPYTITIGRGKKQKRVTEDKVDVYKVQAYSKAREREFTFYKPVAISSSEQKALISAISNKENSVPGKKLKDNHKWMVEAALSTYMAGSLSHSYVINTHKAQGSSYNTVYLDSGNILSQYYSGPNEKSKSLYVGGSRPRKRLIIMDGRYNGSVSNGADMNTIPLVPYTFKDIDTAEQNNINDLFNKCKKG